MKQLGMSNAQADSAKRTNEESSEDSESAKIGGDRDNVAHVLAHHAKRFEAPSNMLFVWHIWETCEDVEWQTLK